MTLSAPPLPRLPDLETAAFIRERYAAFLSEARGRMLEADQLILGLQDNLARADRNRYNLEVMLALAKFIRQHWLLLNGMAGAEEALEEARKASQKNDARRAVGHLVTAYNAIDHVQKTGEQTFAELVAVYEKSRYSKGRSVGGRQFVHVLDDTKDHWADRTPDMGFMMAPERSIGLEKWVAALRQAIQTYAKQHGVPVKGLAEARLEQ